ncbi:unnamed protein product [Toxocara canis]|uniref:Uncharacterized protein n=1 Tax=Toxocara canis TaxID=6265 RepID=A0A183TYU4_TOXCA|nr:unnamed protein product [Toxocara canis]
MEHAKDVVNKSEEEGWRKEQGRITLAAEQAVGQARQGGPQRTARKAHHTTQPTNHRTNAALSGPRALSKGRQASAKTGAEVSLAAGKQYFSTQCQIDTLQEIAERPAAHTPHRGLFSPFPTSSESHHHPPLRQPASDTV